MPMPNLGARSLHFAEQETLDDLAEQMAKLDATTRKVRKLGERIDAEIERVRESVRPKKEPPADEPSHPGS